MAPLVIVRWRTPPPSSINERLIVGDDGRARLEVLRPRTFGDAVGSYEGAVEEAEVRDLITAGREVELDVVVQDPRLGAVAVAADRVGQRLLASPLAVAQFFARSVGDTSPGSATTGAQGARPRLPVGRVPARSCQVRDSVQLRREASVINSACPELPMGFMTLTPRGLGGVRQRAIVAPGVLGAISMPVAVPDGADLLSTSGDRQRGSSRAHGSLKNSQRHIPRLERSELCPQPSRLASRLLIRFS